MSSAPASLHLPASDCRGGARWAPENGALIAFAAAISLLLLLAGLGMRALERSSAVADSVQHTYRALHQVDVVGGALSEALRLASAYVITGDESYLLQREQVVSEVESRLRDLQELTNDSPSQQERIVELRQSVNERLDIANMIIVIRQVDGPAAALALYSSRSPQAVMERIDAQRRVIVETERQLLDQRKQAELESRRRLFVLAAALIALVIAMVVGGLLWLRRELEARRRLARTLEAQQRFVDSILEHIPALVYVKDPKSLRFVALNRAVEAWFGRTREELIGRSVADLLSRDEADSIIASDRQALQQHGVIDIPQNPRCRPDGTRSIYRTLKAVVRDRDDQPLYLLSISIDVSERVAYEQRIQALNEFLEAQKQALQASNRELESFSYSVSHDLRAPLRAIDGLTLMLLEDHEPSLDERARRYLTAIRAGTQRMSQLIDDLLALARLGRQPLRTQSVDMDRLARDAADQALGGATGAAPMLTVHPLPQATGDPGLLEHVWINLLENAIKYSSKVPRPAIEVGARQDGSDTVYFVRDNGAGFDMQCAQKLFGVFQRLHGQDEFPGTGVGLAIVYRIISRHGGRVWAQSAPGQGATFHFCLPGDRRLMTVNDIAPGQ